MEDKALDDDQMQEGLDPVSAELRSMIAEQRMDAILAGLPSGNTTVSAGGVSLSWWDDGEDEDPEAEPSDRVGESQSL